MVDFHSGKWLRAGTFGAMDGLVSNTSLIAGVAGGGASPHIVVLAGVAGLVAGAVSMGLGEYVSVKAFVEAHGHRQFNNPWVAAVSSFVFFGLGAFVPLLPYVFNANDLFWALISGGLGLFLVGVLVSRVTGKFWLWSGVRQLLLGGAATAVTYFVGVLIGVSV